LYKGDNDLERNSIISLKKVSTREKILESAVHLFAIKGYTETTIREIAAVVGVKEASIYNHFPSKKAILEYILEDYASQDYERRSLSTLKKNPTAEGILSCMALNFPEGMVEYYLKELYVILQEQHRNPIVRDFVTEKIILGGEKYFETIINKLKEYNIIRQDTNPDFWLKVHSSLLYTFASRTLLGIGDGEPNFSGLGMLDLLRGMCEMLLETCGTGNTQN
jgi:AcrR family transcriptional regulator